MDKMELKRLNKQFLTKTDDLMSCKDKVGKSMSPQAVAGSQGGGRQEALRGHSPRTKRREALGPGLVPPDSATWAADSRAD